MIQLFLVVLSLSISGTLTGLMIAATHFITEKYFTRKWNYYIWLLVIVQLLLPVYFFPAFSGKLHWQMNLSQPATASATDWMNLPQLPGLQRWISADLKMIQPGLSAARTMNETPNIDITNTSSTKIVTGNTTDYSSAKVTNGNVANPSSPHAADDNITTAHKALKPLTTINLLTAAAHLWFFGFAICLVVKLLNYFLYKAHMKKTCECINDTCVILMENTFCTQLHIQNVPALYKSTTATGPMTIGLFNPVIILPKAFSDSNAPTGTDAYSSANWAKLQLILHHELIHTARKDLLYKWIYQLLLCIHWFNPVLYLIGRQINRDCELSCDEAILARLTKDGKQFYGNILLDTAALVIDNRGNKNALSTTLLEDKKDLKKRLDNILHSKKPTRVQLILSAAVMIVMLALSSCSTVWISAEKMPAPESMADNAIYDLDSPSSLPDEEADSGALPSIASLRHTDTSQTPDNNPDHAADVQKAYEDDKLLAGEDIQVYMGAYNYIGGNRKLRASHLYLHGSDTIVIVYAEQDVDVRIKTSFTISEGKFKVVSIAPDGSVTTLNETGHETWHTITLHKGRNAIKMIGLEAHLENLLVDYSDLNESDFRKVYHSEGEEYAIQLLDRIGAGEPVSKDKFFDAIIYMTSQDVSEVFNALLLSGTTFTDEELYDIFIYSDDTLSSQYFLNAVKAGTTAAPSAATILELMPYLNGDCQTELIKSLSVEEFYDIFAESIYYLNDNQIEDCLTDYLDRGGVLTYSMYDEISPYLNKNISQKLDTRLHSY